METRIRAAPNLHMDWEENEEADRQTHKHPCTRPENNCCASFVFVYCSLVLISIAMMI